MKPVLEIENLYKNYGRIKAVRDLSLTIGAGSVFGLLGPNGSGKTTTLGIVLDVVHKSSGNYKWFGMPANKNSRKKIGAILESPSFYPYLSGIENLKIVAQIKGVSYSRIEYVLKKVNLLDRGTDKFQTYSLGMKQRLAIASALLSDPKVLVLDEPTNGLDPQGIADVRELIINISSEGKTILLASHLLDEVQKVCTDFAVLNKGQAVFSGNVNEALSKKDSVEVAAPDMEKLSNALRDFPGCRDIQNRNGKLIVTLENGSNSFLINQFLVQQGIIISHLSEVRQNLEQQFLEILSQTNDQTISN